MATVGCEELCEQVQALQEIAAAAVENESAQDFEQLERQFNQLDTLLREMHQAAWSTECEAAVDRLESGEPLTQTDLDVIRAFLVADAEHYLTIENNYPDWLNEVPRLVEDIARRSQNVDRDTLGELRGVVKDAVRVVPDIRNYLDERARVERCEVALHTYDTASRSMLAKVLREQLDRPNR